MEQVFFRFHVRFVGAMTRIGSTQVCNVRMLWTEMTLKQSRLQLERIVGLCALGSLWMLLQLHSEFVIT